MFLSESEKKITNEFLENGCIIQPVADQGALEWIRNQYIQIIQSELNISPTINPEQLLNHIEEYVSVDTLNHFRLRMIEGINALEPFREMYFKIARPYLEVLVGNELAMQLRVNLSIQLPNDDSSLLQVHADTWSGDSPFEVVVWLPLVDCFGTKAMYLLSPRASKKLNENFVDRAGKSSKDLYQNIRNEVKWLDVKYGEVLIFNQALPHGNRCNEESETRWSMNCRFKGVFTPYSDKKIGEFFEPITLRAASQTGMKYNPPKVV